MSLQSLFDGLSEVRGALRADLRGEPSEVTGAAAGAEDAAATAAAAVEIEVAGRALRLTRLELLLVKGSRSSTAVALRPDELLLVTADPAKGTAQLEEVLLSWSSVAEARADMAARPDSLAGPPPAPPRASAEPASAVASDPPAVTVRAARATDVTAPAVTEERATRDEPWSRLRWSAARGRLTEAAARCREVGSAADMGRPGSEPLPDAERERAMQALLEGIGSVLAGDGVGGGRILRELAGPAQKNLSLRWLALHWSAWGAIGSGSFTSARVHVKEALTVAQKLDCDARGMSQWIAAEVLAQDGDTARALAWLGEARRRFERIGDRWAIGQTWLSQARLLASLKREQEAVEAARRACTLEPGWEKPPIFLARLALMANDLAQAEAILKPLKTPSADRVRGLIDAMRVGIVSEADAIEFLREQDAPPTERSIRSLARIARAAPGFVLAREALAWMLLKLGKYADASTIFRGLLSLPLTPADRGSVMLGLGCIAHAQQRAPEPARKLRAADSAAGDGSGGAGTPLPSHPVSSLRPHTAQPGSGVPSATLSGQLSVFALPDLFEFLRSARRTGLLVCSSAVGMGTVHFRDGCITWATSPATPHLGEILVGAKQISTLALSTVAPGDEDQPDHVLAARLVRYGLVGREAVQEALRRQIEFTIRELVQWKDGEFAFNQERESDALEMEVVQVDAQAVLLNVFKDMDEQSRMPIASEA